MTKINMKITHLKCHQNLPGANELSSWGTNELMPMAAEIWPQIHLPVLQYSVVF